MQTTCDSNPWKSPKTPGQKWTVAAVGYVHLLLWISAAAIVRCEIRYGESIREFTVFFAWFPATQMSLLACWATLRRPVSRTMIGVVALILFLYGGVLCIGLALMTEKRQTMALLAAVSTVPLAFLFTGAGLFALRHAWWIPSVDTASRSGGRRVFSLGRLFVWMTLAALLIGLVQIVGRLDRLRALPQEFGAVFLVSVISALYTLLISAWIAPRGWIAKLAALPAVAIAVGGIVALEVYPMRHAFGGWGFVFALAMIFGSLVGAGIVLATLLVLRIAGLYVVDSVLGGDRMDGWVKARLQARRERRSKLKTSQQPRKPRRVYVVGACIQLIWGLVILFAWWAVPFASLVFLLRWTPESGGAKWWAVGLCQIFGTLCPWISFTVLFFLQATGIWRQKRWALLMADILAVGSAAYSLLAALYLLILAPRFRETAGESAALLAILIVLGIGLVLPGSQLLVRWTVRRSSWSASRDGLTGRVFSRRLMVAFALVMGSCLAIDAGMYFALKKARSDQLDRATSHREAERARRQAIEARRQAQAKEAVDQWLAAREQGDSPALRKADRRLRDVLAIDSGRVVTRLRFRLKQAHGPQRIAILQLLADKDFAQRSSPAAKRAYYQKKSSRQSSVERAHCQVAQQAFRLLCDERERDEIRSLALAVVWNQNARCNAGQRASVEDTLPRLKHADFAVDLLVKSLSSSEHPFDDPRDVCRLLGKLGPKAQRAIPSLQSLAERDPNLAPDAQEALKKIRGLP